MPSTLLLSRAPRELTRWCAVWCLTAAAVHAGDGAERTTGVDSLDAPAVARALVESHCLDCHTEGAAEAGFALDALSADLGDATAAAAWAKALTRIERGEMPPADYGALPAEESAAGTTALRAALISAERRRRATHGRAELRRLSREEYANALKDLLDLPHLDLAGMLPPDGADRGFAKSGAALDFSHVTVSQILNVADFALREALADHAEPVKSRRVRSELTSLEGVTDTLQTLRVQLKQTSAIPLVGLEIDPTLIATRGNFEKGDPGQLLDPEPKFDGLVTGLNNRSNHNVVVKPFRVPQDGEYVLRVRGWSVRNDHGTLKETDRAGVVAFYAPGGRLLGRCDLPPNVPGVGECRVWLEKDEPVEYLAVSPPSRSNRGFPKDGSPKYSKVDAVGVALQWFEMEGPLPPAGGDSTAAPWPPISHRRLLGDLPLESLADDGNAGGTRRAEPELDPDSGLPYRVVTDDPEGDAERLLRAFADRALRRPATDADLLAPREQIRARLAAGQPFSEAMLAGYRALLTGPAFLLRLERPGRLDGYALATRLALFLWDGPPDEELKAAAASGALLTDAELRRQTERLLNDPRSDRFVARFLDRWLDVEDIRLTEPDENLYPEHTDFLTESMVEETRGFFAAMLTDDLPVSHVYDSDFLTINQPLAELYGIEGVRGSAIRRVPIPPDHVRGGLLTQAALLKVTANGTTTSPVVRGVFVMDRLLGDPPPPPPPNVPAIEPDLAGAVTVRELLTAHRADPACAGCHTKIDPPGFALESFDVTGAFRDRYRVLWDGTGERPDSDDGLDRGYQPGPAVETDGVLPPLLGPAGGTAGGGAFTDVNEFRDRLRDADRAIADNLLRRLVLYATGAPVGLADETGFAAALDRLEPGGFGLRAMVHEVVQSDLFRVK